MGGTTAGTAAHRHDVIVVGARCAGAPLATHLARAGRSVAVLDRATFPSDTVSTHLFGSDALAAMRRLGVEDAVRATGAPSLRRAAAVLGGVDLSHRFGDGAGEVLCVRRTTLDPILVDAARAAGAELRTGTRVVRLLRDGARVCGVAAAGRDGRAVELRAPLVVGADGRHSTVARAVGARRYNVVANDRASFYAYYRDWRREDPPRVHFHRRGEDVVLALPTDGDLMLVIAAPPLHRLAQVHRDGPDRAFPDYIRGFPALAGLLDGAERVGGLRALRRFPGYFRESAGPGWALVGDAGHFKDPVSGHGIADALHQAESLAAAVRDGVDGRAADAALARWWRARDRAAAELYWFATDLQRCGDIPAIVRRMLRDLAATPAGRQQFWDCFLRGRAPSQVFTPVRLARAVGSLLGEGPGAGAVAEAGGMLREELRRRRRVRRPSFEAA